MSDAGRGADCRAAGSRLITRSHDTRSRTLSTTALVERPRRAPSSSALVERSRHGVRARAFAAALFPFWGVFHLAPSPRFPSPAVPAVMDQLADALTFFAVFLFSTTLHEAA